MTTRQFALLTLSVLSATVFALPSHADNRGNQAWITSEPKPVWIWTRENVGNKNVFFRRTFTAPAAIKSARIYTTIDNTGEIWLNGKKLGDIRNWEAPMILDNVGAHLVAGAENLLAVRGANQGGPAGFILKLEITAADGSTTHVLSGPDSWTSSTQASTGWEKGATAEGESWTNDSLVAHGSLGVQPWGVPCHPEAAPAPAKPDPQPRVTQPESLTVAEGFEVDLVHIVPRATQGSWVSLCRDPEGRFYACDQKNSGLHRITIGEDGAATVEPVPISLPDGKKIAGGAQGLEWAFGSLWFNQNPGALYRIDDTNGDGLPETAVAQGRARQSGEHSAHAVLLDETGKQLYLVGGNYTGLPDANSITRRRIQSWKEDLLLHRMWDARGHARGLLAPGGWISRFDPETKTHDIVSSGYRNQYDATLNSAGDLFTYDADMEWDVGSHWYRPTRINFAVSGSDYGWRSGSGKWPSYYEDSLPAVVDIGPGSPTGFVAGTGAKFPEKYQRALYGLDWTFGTIWAVHPVQDGAGYTGEKEPFVFGLPLPLTDAEIGLDGHLYFLIGGRGTQSALYRVRYVGSESTAPAKALEPTPERKLARELEAFHGVADPQAVETAWPQLGSPDRFLRHAARVAIESQDPAGWAERVLAENNPQALIAGAVALARSGEAAHQAPLLDALLGLDFASLDTGQQLGTLRALALTFIRLGKPDEAQRAAAIAWLDPHLPADHADVNTELIRVSSYLQSPTVVAKTIALIENRGEPEVPDWAEIVKRNAQYGGPIAKFLEKTPPAREVYHVFMISQVHKGWTLESRRAAIKLLNEAGKCSGGPSYAGFLANIREFVLAGASNRDRAALADISGENFNPVPDFPITPPTGPGRVWTLAEALPHGNNLSGANFERGRNLYFATSCGACHRVGGLGGSIGPDLTSIPNKFDARYVLEAIIDPSKDISDQYGSKIVTLNDGKTRHIGLVVEQGDQVDVYGHDPKADPITLSHSDIQSIEESPVSQMPPGLINTLNDTELRDLMGYLMSGGDRTNRRIYGR